MIPNYEYKIIKLDDEDLDLMEKKLNLLGKEAWNLISFDGEIAIFKRKELYFTDSRETLLSGDRPRPI